MERFVPYQKLSKKKKREMDREKRNTWGPLDPVTRIRESKKTYDRKKAHRWDEDHAGAFFVA